MNIVMSGIDHTMARVERRECFSLSQADQRRLLREAAEHPEVLGAAVLSTCNRTELYLSLREGAALDPFARFFGEPEERYETLTDEEAFRHLAALACGVKSRIFGEEQILTQVKNAIAFARAERAADGVLEVLFRVAVSTAKDIRTQIRLRSADASVSAAALRLLARHGGIRRVLVIGNGEVGRQTADALARADYQVTMTLRRYRHGEVSIPRGVSVVEYDRRYECLSSFDCVVSATSSPHCTVSAARLADIPHPPRLYIDLAMPRDIEPEVGLLPGVALYDIDQVADAAGRRANELEKLEAMEPMLRQGWEELLRWAHGRAGFLRQEPKTHFPLFVDSTGKTALVVGGGAIAARRAAALAGFSFAIRVVAPQAREDILRLAESGRLTLERREFQDGDLDGVFLVVAATDSRAVNGRVAALARHRGVYASIADRREECSFYFPAIAENETVTAGVCGDGVAHRSVSAAAKKIREVLDEASEHRQP